VPVAGQVASLTSTNNFINFCLTVPNLPITNGQQVKAGSCNPAPMGIIAANTNMPASKFVQPVNGQDFPANAAFTISMAVNHLETGNFVNAASNYYAAPQQVNTAGDIIGHTHFTVQTIDSFTSTTVLDSSKFAFFKGVNGAAVNGVVSEPVANGLPAGNYRLCSINTDANHAPTLVAVAQHGSLDDCVYVSSVVSSMLGSRLIRFPSSLPAVAVVRIPSLAMEATTPAMRPTTGLLLLVPTTGLLLLLVTTMLVPITGLPSRLHPLLLPRLQRLVTRQTRVTTERTTRARRVAAGTRRVDVGVAVKRASGVTEQRITRERVEHVARRYWFPSFL